MSTRRATRRFYLTPATMAYPHGRVAAHTPGTAAVYVIETDGQWSPITGRHSPEKTWKRLSVEDARARLGDWADAADRVPTDTPEASGHGQSTYRTATT